MWPVTVWRPLQGKFALPPNISGTTHDFIVPKHGTGRGMYFHQLHVDQSSQSTCMITANWIGSDGLPKRSSAFRFSRKDVSNSESRCRKGSLTQCEQVMSWRYQCIGSSLKLKHFKAFYEASVVSLSIPDSVVELCNGVENLAHHRNLNAVAYCLVSIEAFLFLTVLLNLVMPAFRGTEVFVDVEST